MTVRHLNCGPLNPPSQRLVEGGGSIARRGRAVCHCLLIDADVGLVLVDTGLAATELLHPRRTLGIDVAFLLAPTADAAATAKRQVIASGFDPSEVRHIYMTHLDVDYRAGLSDFPDAAVHIHDTELASAHGPRTIMERRRYRGGWIEDPHWITHQPTGEQWFGLPVLHEFEHSGPRIVMVELPGHSRGHSGVAVQTVEADGSLRWLLHAVSCS
ncbi:MBL fold metallo-hydrolase [Rhodococcus sp. NPDC057297]|uniref:MBL fold metallo-hydrolase n=1 Tax=Rhodococcus sp. NPDC057297 TaxID=3346090 RepID=UPI003629E66E